MGEDETLTEFKKKEIDTMNFDEMLRLYRFAKSGHPMITGDVGEYFLSKFFERKKNMLHSDFVAASKRVGWGNDR